MPRLTLALTASFLLTWGPAVPSARAICRPLGYVWPATGMVDVARDVSVVVFCPPDAVPDALRLRPDSGVPVSLTQTVEAVGDWMLIIATPPAPLAGLTRHTLLGLPPAVCFEGHHEPSFTTRAEAEPPPAPDPPRFEFRGVAVREQDCWVEDSTDAWLPLRFDPGPVDGWTAGDDLGDAPLWIEVRDATGTTVLERLHPGTAISAEWQYSTDLSDSNCAPQFDVHRGERYCVRAAFLDPHGRPGAWSDEVCGDDVGLQDCHGTSIDWGDDDGCAVAPGTGAMPPVGLVVLALLGLARLIRRACP